jgi:hypothetical protein
MNGWVEQYGDGSFKNLCLKVERFAGLFPQELWHDFNAVFDYLPIAAVSLLLVLVSHPSHHRQLRSFKAPSLQSTEACPAAQLGSTYAQVRPRVCRRALSQRCVAESTDAVGCSPIETLLETLPRPWDGENPSDEGQLARTAGCVSSAPHFVLF